MAEITAAAVMALREKTGLPMMECKKALAECGGDLDRMLERFVELHHGPAIAREFAARQRQQR